MIAIFQLRNHRNILRNLYSNLGCDFDLIVHKQYVMPSESGRSVNAFAEECEDY